MHSDTRTIFAAFAAFAAAAIWTPCGHAHMLWLDSVGDDEKRAALFFSEGPGDRDYHLPESIAAAEVFVRDAQGNRSKLKLVEADVDEFIGLKSADSIAGPCMLETVCRYGVYHGTLLTYYGTHILGAYPGGRSAPPQERKLDIVPQLDPQRTSCTVYWQGEPAAGVNVTLTGPSGEQSEAETNGEGVAEFPLLRESGLIAMTARRNESGVDGELDGEPYRGAMNFATLTMHYDPATTDERANRRAATTGLPELPEAIASFGAAVSDGWLYVYGGHTGREHAHSRDNHSMRFGRVNLSAGGDWQPLPLPQALQGLAMAAHDGRIYRVGGVHSRNAPGEESDMHSTDVFAVFDPQTGEWSELPPLPAPRSSHDAVVLDGKLYVVGGWNLSGEPSDNWQEDALVYDLDAGAEGEWTTLPKPPFVRRAVAAAAYDGRLWVVGGIDDYRDVSNSVFVFDPQTNQWSEGPSITEDGMQGFGAAAWGGDEGLFVSPADGGVYRLDESERAWKQIGEAAVPRFFHRLLPGLDGSLLVIAGASMSDGHMASIEILPVE